MITFDVDEIYEIAEQIERNGAKFYRKAAESARGDSRELLLRLAAMEDDHEKTFAAMRSELKGFEKTSFTADPDNEAALYLQAMAEGKVFDSDPASSLSGDEPITHILTTAVSLEKDSVIFYESMKEMVPAAAGVEKIDAIIRQEIGHIVDLNNQLRASRQ